MVVCTYHPYIWEAKADDNKVKAYLYNLARPCIKMKKYKGI